MRRHTKTESIRIFFLFSSLYSYNGLYFFITSLFWGCVWCRLMVILLKFIGNESCITRKQVHICCYWWSSRSRCNWLCLREFPGKFLKLYFKPQTTWIELALMEFFESFQTTRKKNNKIFHRYIKTYEINRRKVFFEQWKNTPTEYLG